MQEKFLGIDLMKIIPRVRSLNDHDEEIAPVVEVMVADGWFEEVAVFLDPGVEVDR